MNFPVSLLKGFMENKKQVLNDIKDYALTKKYLEEKEYDDSYSMEDCADYFEMVVNNPDNVLENGQALIDSILPKVPMVGLNVDIFFDYYNNEKDDFQKATLLGFLAIKSILMNKPFCKITNSYILARMCGMAKARDYNHNLLPDSLLKYSNRYHLDKIKWELQVNWKLKLIGGRGFYVSFSMSLENLAIEKEKRKLTAKRKRIADEKRRAIKFANELINKSPRAYLC